MKIDPYSVRYLAKELTLAAIPASTIGSDSKKAAEQIGEMYEIIFKKLESVMKQSKS
jgi:hypothetical protein